jgi:hypothetical protein
MPEAQQGQRPGRGEREPRHEPAGAVVREEAGDRDYDHDHEYEHD